MAFNPLQHKGAVFVILVLQYIPLLLSQEKQKPNPSSVGVRKKTSFQVRDITGKKSGPFLFRVLMVTCLQGLENYL